MTARWPSRRKLPLPDRVIVGLCALIAAGALALAAAGSAILDSDGPQHGTVPGPGHWHDSERILYDINGDETPDFALTPPGAGAP